MDVVAQNICRELSGNAAAECIAIQGIAYHAGAASFRVTSLTTLLEEVCPGAPPAGISDRHEGFIDPTALDLVIAFDCFDRIWEWPLRALGIRAACILDDLRPLRGQETWDEAQEFRYFRALSTVVDRAEILFTDSWASSQRLEGLFPEVASKTRVLTLGDSGCGHLAGQGRTLTIPEGSIRSLTVLVIADSECAGVRNFLGAIPALASACAPRPLVVGAVVGGLNGLVESELLDRARCHAAVVVTKEDDPSARRFWYGRADIVVVPTELGDSYLAREAAASGIPLVLSENATHRELGGLACAYMDPYDPGRIVEAVLGVSVSTTAPGHGARIANSSISGWAAAVHEVLAACHPDGGARIADAPLHSAGRLVVDSAASGESAEHFHARSSVPLPSAPEEPNLMKASPIAGIFDEIVAHGGLAQCVSFHEALADGPSSRLGASQRAWLTRYATCFDRPIDVLAVASSLERLKMFRPKRTILGGGKCWTLDVIYSVDRRTGGQESGRMPLRSIDGLAALICGSRSVAVFDDQAGRLHPVVADLSAKLGKPMSLMTGSQNGDLAAGTTSRGERQPLGSAESNARAASAIACPSEWPQIAQALRLMAIGASPRLVRESVKSVELLSPQIAEWIGYGIGGSYYADQWARLTKPQVEARALLDAGSIKRREETGLFAAVRNNFRKARAARFQRLADAARDSGDWALGERHFGQALAILPDRADIRVQLGHMLKEQGKVQSALQQYTIAATLAPDSADALFQQAHAWKLLGECAASTYVFLGVLELDRRHRAARRELQLLGWSETEIVGALRRRRGEATASPKLLPGLIELLAFDL